MRKRIYRSTPVNELDIPRLAEAVRGRRVVIGVDVAKRDFKAAVLEPGQGGLATLSWRAPEQVSTFTRFVAELGKVAEVEVALEPTGTYGDPLRTMLIALGVPVFKVSAKHSHDAAELYDGVPSQHDAKCAAIVAWLHAQGRSSRWEEMPEAMRDLAAAVDLMVLFDKQEQGCLGRLEARLARHFPELTMHLELGSATMLSLCETFGDAQAIAAHATEARALMRKVGGALLSSAKIEQVIEAAQSSTGVAASAGERSALQVLAREANRQRKEAAAARHKVEELGQSHAPVARMSEVIGKASAAVVFAEAGDPGAYAAPKAYVKALGLNLKIRNSGKPADQGRLKITKRGSSMSRKYLYFAVLRLLQNERCFKAWYERKRERDGGKQNLKAVIALMRKLAAALWHVARGAAFEPTRLFDVGRLGLGA